MAVSVIQDLAAVDAAAWDALSEARYPFLRHAFLAGLEQTGCLGSEVGWFPRHLLVRDGDALVAALPMYLKANSFGEFVFDWAWAEAYERAGGRYYPKLVIAPPFTPATGPRLLANNRVYTAELLAAAIEQAEAARLSSIHWLFAADPEFLESADLLPRMGVQFHWFNYGYACFEDFLGELTAKRRKDLLRERRQVAEHGVALRRVMGGAVTVDEWAAFHALYLDTFAKHGNYPALTLAFFQALGQTLGDEVMVVFAERAGAIVATAFFLVGADALYGRYWGCFEDVPGLHFEACYYQGIEFAIERGLTCFEPGAQGEHKISRGFVPVPTWSYHWLGDTGFRRAVKQHLDLERQHMRRYGETLGARAPFREPIAAERLHRWEA